MLDMARILRYRHTQLEMLRSGRQKAIIVGGVPVPAGEDALAGSGAERGGFLGAEMRDEVGREAELMRRLERSRFRDAFFDEVALPHGRAICLEDFEAGLRAAGLVGVDQILVQSGRSGRKFRVAERRIAVDGHLNAFSEIVGVGNALLSSAVVTEAHNRALCQARKPSIVKGRRPRF